MSGKQEKKSRKVDEAKKAESLSRLKAFMKTVEDASFKYKVDLVASLQYKKMGIVPVINAIDVKEKYEHMTEEAKKAEAAKKQTGNGKVKNDNLPKLEV